MAEEKTELDSDSLGKLFLEQMRENLKHNVAANKAQLEQLEYPMNGPCC